MTYFRRLSLNTVSAVR